MYVVSQWHHVRKQFVRFTTAIFIVLNATQYGRRTQIASTNFEFGARQPLSRQDAVIERQGFIATNKIRCVHDTEKLLASLWMDPQIHADHVITKNDAAGFRKHLTHHGLLGCFVCLNMAARLVKNDQPHGMLFDQ